MMGCSVLKLAKMWICFLLLCLGQPAFLLGSGRCLLFPLKPNESECVRWRHLRNCQLDSCLFRKIEFHTCNAMKWMVVADSRNYRNLRIACKIKSGGIPFFLSFFGNAMLAAEKVRQTYRIILTQAIQNLTVSNSFSFSLIFTLGFLYLTQFM